MGSFTRGQRAMGRGQRSLLPRFVSACDWFEGSGQQLDQTFLVHCSSRELRVKAIAGCSDRREMMIAEKAMAFRSLHQRSQAFVIPNPWDVGTAKML